MVIEQEMNRDLQLFDSNLSPGFDFAGRRIRRGGTKSDHVAAANDLGPGSGDSQ